MGSSTDSGDSRIREADARAQRHPAHLPARRRIDRGAPSPRGGPPENAVITTDRSSRVAAWNDAAEALLGFRSAEVLGKPLQAVLQARDLFGNRLCTSGCGVQEMLALGEPVRPFVVDVKTGSGEPLRVVMSVERGPEQDGAGRRVVYSVKPDGRRRTRDRRSFDQQSVISLLGKVASSDDASAFARLTVSERNVLKLLSSGGSTREIAASLGISASTARNHIQHVLVKLGVRSKLQAVSIALRGGLV